MKKTKFIPALLLAGLLASCSGGISEKEPKFKDASNKVDYAVFMEKLTAAQSKSEIVKEDSVLTDRAVNIRSVRLSESSTKRGEKEIKKSNGKALSKSETQFDFDTSVAKAISSAVSNESDKSPSGKGSYQAYENNVYYYQAGKVENVNYLLMIDDKEKAYRPQDNVEGDDKYFTHFVKETLFGLVSSYFLYRLPEATAVASKPDDYNFYVDNSETLFTFDYVTETTEDTSEYYTRVTNRTVKGQLDITDGKQSIAYKSESVITTTYKKSYYDSYAKDDVTVNNSKEYFEGLVNEKAFDIKAVDLTDYTLLN